MKMPSFPTQHLTEPRTKPARRAHPAVVSQAILLALSAALVLSWSLAKPAWASPGEDLATFIAREFPDRRTSSYDSQRLISFISGQLQNRGWTAEVKPYSALVKALAPGSPDIELVLVSGENLLAYRFPPAQTNAVDLLIVAPYDVLFKEATGQGATPSYTARATAVLVDFAAAFDPATCPLNVVLAFVSGHYQYGAGLESLLSELGRPGATPVRAALVIGDINALDSLPIAVGDYTPAAFASAVVEAAQRSGVRATVVGPRARDAWYRSVMRPSGGYSAEFLFDNGSFWGEAESLASRDIPALTLGMPRGDAAPQVAAEAQRAGIATAPGTQKSQMAVDTLRTLLSLPGLPESIAGGGRPVLDTIIFQLAGEAFFTPRTAVIAAGSVVALAAMAALVLSLRSQRDLGPLALLCGILAAFIASHGLRSVWISTGAGAYSASRYPGRPLFLYLWSAFILVLLGFLRLWRVRTRIALLKSRMPARVKNGAGGAGTAGSGANGVAQARAPAPPVRGWAGPWGLALAAAVLAGTSAQGSELAPPAALATLSLSAAVVLAHLRSRRGAGGRSGVRGDLCVWVQRFLCTVPLLPVVFWAGWPLGGDALRVYAASLSVPATETVSFTILLAVLTASLLSTFQFPAPASPKRLKAMALSEPLTVLLLVVVGFAVPRWGASGLPVTAIVKESLGNEGRISVDTPRPLGDIALVQPGAPPAGPGVPLKIASRSLSDAARFSLLPIQSPWADLRQVTVEQVKGKEETKVSAETIATLSRQPTFYQVKFQDVPAGRTSQNPFRLLDLRAIVGAHAEVNPDVGIVPSPGYSVSVVWWMPKEPVLTTPYTFSYSPVASRVDVSSRAVFLDGSSLGLSPSAANARMLLVTYVTQQWAYR